MAYQSQLKKFRGPNLRIYVGVFLAIFLIMFILFHYANRTEELYQLHRRPDLAVIESWKVCQENFLKKDLHQEQEKIIYVVTPTYSKFEQVAQLTRLVQTLFHVKDVLHWIIAHDSNKCPTKIINLLKRYPEISYTVLIAPTPEVLKTPESVKRYGLARRGVSGRRASIKWLLSKTSSKSSESTSILYFGDGHNTYDVRLFQELLQIGPGKVGMFPVGLIEPWGISGPIVNLKTGKVQGFINEPRSYAYEGGVLGGSRRRFPVDMSGFAVHLSLIHTRSELGANIMPYHQPYQEEGFLNSLQLKYEDIVPLAKNCTEIYVWRTMTFTPPFRQMSSKDTVLLSNRDLHSTPPYETNLPTLINGLIT